MTSIFARCVPGGYDTNHTVAKALTHASLACALLGCAGGFLGTGYLASVVAMHVLMLIAMETNTRGLLKVRRMMRMIDRCE
jgi:fructose-1-phosphate kinase PfkB-like protein